MFIIKGRQELTVTLEFSLQNNANFYCWIIVVMKLTELILNLEQPKPMFLAVLFLFIRLFPVAVQGYEKTISPTITAQSRAESELISIIYYLFNYRIPWL